MICVSYEGKYKTMKLAEALQERADLNKRLEQLRSRLNSNATVQEGERPAEEPTELLTETDACLTCLGWLIAAINRTNSRSVVDGRSLTEWIAEKDVLTQKLSIYRSFLQSASNLTWRASGREIKIRSTVNVRELQKQVDAMSKQLRETDNRLQQANWTTDLIL